MATIGARDRSRSPHAVSTEEILQLIFMREQARQAKNFTEADQIRERLNNAGVHLFDKTDQWRTDDGRSGKIPSWTDMESGATPEIALAQAQQLQADSMHGDVHGNIKLLVQQREQARASKDFTEADRLRDELKAMGIEVYDKEKLWKGQDGSCGVVIGYLGTQVTDLEITTLITQREKARQNKEWEVSDMIRDELKNHGVLIYDKEKIWKTTDGRSGPVPPYGGATGANANMVAAAAALGGFAGGGAGGSSLSALQSQVVQAALVASQTPAQAQKTLELLRACAMGMGAAPPSAVKAEPGFGRGAKASAQSAAKSMNGGAASPQAKEVFDFIAMAQGRVLADDEISWLVECRERLRQSKDFANSDGVRTAMKALGIELLEKEKRWTCTDGRSGMIPGWDALASM